MDGDNKGTKSKLKGLFDEMDSSKKKSKGKGSKNDKNGNLVSSYRIKTEVDPSKYKTKPTKPDFSAQIIESGITGLNLNSEIQYKGLTNYGNICYSNVIMQCVIGLKEFVNMLNIIFKKMEDLDNIENEYPVLFNLVKIMNYYQSRKFSKNKYI
jgi:hypothetical protein